MTTHGNKADLILKLGDLHMKTKWNVMDTNLERFGVYFEAGSADLRIQTSDDVKLTHQTMGQCQLMQCDLQEQF